MDSIIQEHECYVLFIIDASEFHSFFSVGLQFLKTNETAHGGLVLSASATSQCSVKPVNPHSPTRKQVSITRKCHNHIHQINPWDCEEET